MGWIKGFFERFFHKDDDDDFFNEYYEDNTKEEDGETYTWDWESLADKRNLFKLSDEIARGKYIRSLIEQIKDASGELDKLSYEYNIVTASLKDMDELDSLPEGQKRELRDCAKQVLYFEGEKREFGEKKSKMTDMQYNAMEQMEEYMPKAYDDIKKAEDYKILIKDDLQKLDGEKHGFCYRQAELLRDIENCKGMALICVVAMSLCLVMLLILQFGFEMKTGIGYIIIGLAGAVALTILYLKFLECRQELERTQKGINRIILLQNTVKIRYVNNTNLLEYLYMKYHTKSAKELNHLWNLFLEERNERELNRKNEEELNTVKNELLHILHRYQLTDAQTWVHNPAALIDHNEMIEIRHNFIGQRQKLRARIDYNKRLAKDGERELKEFSRNYPQYAKEVIELMNRY